MTGTGPIRLPFDDKLPISGYWLGPGKATITVNGKTFGGLGLWSGNVGRDGQREIFAVLLAGRNILHPDDLDTHWRVVRRGSLQLAFNARQFSYHLIAGEDQPATHEDKWPKLKSEPFRYAFIGPTKEACLAQIKLVVERFSQRRSGMDGLAYEQEEDWLQLSNLTALTVKHSQFWKHPPRS